MANILVNSSVRNALLNAFVGRGSSSVTVGTGSCYLALSNTAPTYTSSGDITNVTEPTDSNYQRVLLGINSISSSYKFGASSNGSITNTAEIHFNTAGSSGWTGSWGYWAIYSTVAGGTPLLAGSFNSAVTVTENKIVCIKKSQMTINLMPTV